jgi:ABC-2 type transport system ATP-binding protein
MHITIETHNLGKQYGPLMAVDDVSLQVGQGEIYAFLGLNGAGKTTTIRMLLGMIRPTMGAAYLLGHRIAHGQPAPWASVGYLVETPHAYPELTVYENIDLFRRLRPGIARTAVAQVIDRLGLGPYAHRRARTLSLGNMQRLGLAKALLHQPAVLILDEPTNGLDPAGMVEIRELLRTLAHEQGVTVFVSSHLLAEVARLAHRIGILQQGRLLQELTIKELQHNRAQRLLMDARNVPAAYATLRNRGYTAQLTPDGLIAVTDPLAIQRPDEIATLLVNAGHPPTRLTVEQEELEAYFLRLVGKEGQVTHA